jgi:hypothetical protein
VEPAAGISSLARHTVFGVVLRDGRRRISLLHRQGRSWAEIGEQVGQRSKIVTADRYTHALVEYREIDRAKLLARARAVQSPVRSSAASDGAFAEVFSASHLTRAAKPDAWLRGSSGSDASPMLAACPLCARSEQARESRG